MQMKINDRFLLGIVAGVTGNIVKTAIDEISLRMKISQRSFRSTAAGVWVDKTNEATNVKGQLLGSVFDFGMAALGGVGMVELLTRTGRDHLITKGITSGITIGAAITALLSMYPKNKVRPKDAASNLSYIFSNAVYGLVATGIASWLGTPDLYDVEPRNDYLQPTTRTTLQKSYPEIQPRHEVGTVPKA